MTSRQLDEEAVFHTARKIEHSEARAEYLDQICAGDQALRERVEELLDVHEQEEEFLKPSPESTPTTDHTPLNERPSTTIGRYRLMEQIGEGGMGVVFVAEQERPIRRKVALKVIKPGMDSRAVVARFEAERQALAMMDHPNIAKVLDAGTTESGRPYFAMELVKGIPITEYCDKNRLTIRERLDLFMQVCHAIQHAHQKGIIHRDIKPSNVLVTLHDGKPIPKVIDFGVAKAINARLTDKTIYTEHLQIVGTLLYMSPEQAEMSGLDVDTRSDVYSLGVLLYELLTGTTPFQQDQLGKAGFDEQRRMIRENDPPRASQRISGLGETATTIAEHRKTDPKKLHQVVRGDLDWIVAKALEKDRTRRYETANHFAADVQRHLTNEPVEASPPSSIYRMKKLCVRYRGPAMATLAVAITLVGGMIGTSVAMIRAMRHAAALESREKQLRELLLEDALANAMGGDFIRAEEMLRKARLIGASQSWEQLVQGIVALYNGHSFKAASLLQSIDSLDIGTIATKAALATALLHAGRLDECFPLVAELQSASPKTHYDFLFRGLAGIYANSDTAVKDLREVVRRRPNWALAHVVLAEALAELALERDKIEYAEEACTLMAVWRDSLRHNPYAIAVRLQANHVSMRMGKKLGHNIFAEQIAAAKAAEELETYREFVFGRWLRALYYEHVGELEKAEDDYRATVRVSDARLWRMLCGSYLYKAGKADEGLRMKGPIWLCRDGQSNCEEALRAFDDIMSDPESPIQVRIWAQQVLVFTGQYHKALQNWRQLDDELNIKAFMLEWPLELFTGKIRPNDLLLRAKTTGLNKQIAGAHYLIAMHYLYQGKPSDAQPHLERVLELDMFTDNIPHMAAGLLREIENDSKWPYVPVQGAE